ncbi:RAD50-interacting protein 1-like isoform X2 [Actinia tenebrosa]|uniref:RAD50-interacting protein 1-like isoform X2 n=1 Tax=Actinia tenebrosa TaxID=6105 RepID=A0A6P8J3J7_ACTTE|nr:RAD50-interacting protein 1-like isoform X2 [Actinia tenebrosa]
MASHLDDAKKTKPVEVQEALDNGKSSMENIKDLQTQREEVLEKAKSKVNKVKPLAEHLSHLADQVADIERFRTYISWIQKLEAVSTGIQENLEVGILGAAVDQYSILAAVTKVLESSSCDNLKAFSQEMLIFWRRVLLEKLASEFDEVTKALRWPFTSLSTAPPLSTTSEVYKKLEKLFLLLLKIQDSKVSDNDESISKAGVKEKEVPLPIDWLLKPLRKRFKFHFYGKKQTNNLEKPEWFFTQILNWIKSHGDFIQHTVQPIFDKANLGYIDAKFEFIRGLLKITVEKMEHSVPLLLTDDALFSHFVDETLLFQQEVHNLYDYPTSDHQCLNVLVMPKCLDKWVELEHRYAKENLKSLVTSSTAWKGKYQDVGGEVDETRTPECAEGFVTLLTVITDRYKDLTSHENQMRFLDVQLDLLREFIDDQLNEKAKEYSNNPIDPMFLSVLNAAHFISYVLEDWTEQAIFLQLHEQKLLSNCEAPDEQSTGVFDHSLRKLHNLKEKMLQKIVEKVINDFKDRSTAYKRERWHSLPSPKELAVMALSSGACDLLLFLKDRLKNFERQLARALFSTLWQRLAQELNNVIYKEVILECHYNEGGAAQLQFDMTKHLFTLFGEYTSKPENYFKEVKECCILLNQLPGSAILIMETLNNRQSYVDDLNSSPKATLNELGVYRLSPKDALRVLNLRINWPKT